jgi:hypothetical protein
MRCGGSDRPSEQRVRKLDSPPDPVHRVPPLPKIGKHFGDRDHTTVLHANTKITNMIRADRTVYNLVQELTARIKQVR